MYTFSRAFVGIPLTQTSFNQTRELIETLSKFASEHHSIYGVETEDLEKEQTDAFNFIEWAQQNAEQLKKLGVDLTHNYHGGEEYPEIFGVYIDKLFPLPDFAAQKLDFSQLEKINTILNEFRNILASLHPDTLEKIESDQLVGIWTNNHSS